MVFGWWEESLSSINNSWMVFHRRIGSFPGFFIVEMSEMFVSSIHTRDVVPPK